MRKGRYGSPTFLRKTRGLLLLALFACGGGGGGAPAAKQGIELQPLPAPPPLEIRQAALPGQAGELAVVVARPRGAAQADARPTITFSRPVVALGNEAGTGLEGYLRLDPPAAGAWRWLGSSTVEFVPEGRLRLGTRYEVRVEAGLPALDGARLASPHVHAFTTPAPRLRHASPLDGYRWVDESTVFRLLFDQPVRDLPRHAWLEVEDQGRVDLRLVRAIDLKEPAPDVPRGFWSPKEARALYEMEPVAPLQREKGVVLVIAGELLGEEGPLPMGGELRTAYRSRGNMHIEGLSTCQWEGACSWGPLRIATRNLASIETLRGRLHFDPPVEIDWERAESRLPQSWERGGAVVVLPGKFRPGTTYAVRIDAGVEDDRGERSPAWEGEASFQDLPPAFDLGAERALIESEREGSLPVEVMNLSRLEASIWHLSPAEMAVALQRMEPPPRAPFRKTLESEGTRNVGRWVPLEVREAFPPGARTGLFLATVEAPGLKGYTMKQRVLGQVSDLAVHAKLGASAGVVWVSRLSTGASVSGAAITLYDEEGKRIWSGRSDAEGLARLPGLAEAIPGGRPWSIPFALVAAEKEGDIGIATSDWQGMVSPYGFDLPVSWDGERPIGQGLIFSDRGIYRAGEEVHLKGVLRSRTLGKVERPPEGSAVLVRIRDPRGEVQEREAKVNRFGTFALTLELDEDAPLGTFQVEVSQGSGDRQVHYEHSFRVEAYRAPNFRVDLELGRKEAMAGDALEAVLSARYLFGAPITDARVAWTLSRESIDFAPPGHEGFVFGPRVWWRDDELPHASRGIAASGEGRSDLQGRLALDLGEAEAPADRSWSYTLEGEVTDLDRQRVAGRASFLVHPASWYVGVRPKGMAGFGRVGEAVEVELVAAAPDGRRVEGAPIELEVRRRSWKSVRKKGVGGEWYTVSEPEELRVAGCELRSGAEPVSCSFTPAEAGFYVLDARTKDEGGRGQRSLSAFYVVGSGWVSWQREDGERIDLVADRGLYRPGETARILVKSPFPAAEALVTVEREGVISAKRVRLEGSAQTIDVPIDDSMVPNVYVGVLLQRGRVEGNEEVPNADTGRPLVRLGYTELRVETGGKRLQVEVKPQVGKARPREKLQVDLQVRDAAGKGVPAELVVWAVDEGVLRLTDYRIPDPVEAMHPTRGLSVRNALSLMHLVQRRIYGEKGMNPGAASPGGGGGDGSGAGFRGHFKTTALFAPEVVADAQGRARVRIDLPDNLTTYRVMAVAITPEDRFGAGQSQVEVAQPLLALPALPRAVRVGDRFAAGVVVHAPGLPRGEVSVRAQVEGLQLLGPAEQRVLVGPGQPVEVRFPFRAAAPGKARFRFSVAGGGERDGLEQSIPVTLPVVLETFATYGETRGEAREALSLPEGVRADVGGLELSFASTALAGLEDGMMQLVEYPWGCVEQEASRLTPFLALRELAGRFGVPWDARLVDDFLGAEALRERFGSEDPDEVIRTVIRRIEKLQAHDGGHLYWASNACSSPPGSAYALLALSRAKALGYPVDEEGLARSRRYLASVAAGQAARCWGGMEVDRPARLFALWALARAGAPLPSYYGEMWEAREELPLFGKAMLADALFLEKGDAQRERARRLQDEIFALAKESAEQVHFEEAPGERLAYAHLWSSELRSSALVLQTLATVSPEHPYVSKLSRYLLGARGPDGRWGSTQEAAFALMALVEVTRQREREPTDFVATALLGKERLGPFAFDGRSLGVQRHRLPMSALRPGSLQLKKEGSGLLYYTARLQVAAQEMPVEAQEAGFTVQRWVEPWGGGGQIHAVGAGELVRMKVRIATPQERHYVVVELPLPSGLEAVDTSLATTARLPEPQGWNPDHEDEEEALPPWAFTFFDPFQHVERRDDRVVFFADRLPPGLHTLEVVARATMEGRFLLPAAKAEQMYAPEVRGRSEAGSFTVRTGAEVAAD